MALENGLPSLKSQALAGAGIADAKRRPDRHPSGLGLGVDRVSLPFAPGGAQRLRAMLRLLERQLQRQRKKVGTLHDMRFVFVDNDTKFLFATAYRRRVGPLHRGLRDEDSRTRWTSSSLRSKVSQGFITRTVKDWIVKHQIPAEGLVRHPSGSDRRRRPRRLKRVGKAVEEFLDKVG